MSDTKWTPGPWVITEPHGQGSGIEIVNREVSGMPCAELNTFSGSPETWANAHLIAAAPDLYQALDRMIEWHCVRGGDESPILDYEFQPHEIRHGMDALAKARGES